MAKKKKEIKDITLQSPAKKEPVVEIVSKDQLDDLLNRLTRTGRNMLELEAERDKKIAALKEEYEKQMKFLKTIAITLFQSVVAFSLKNRNELLSEDAKSVDFTNATLGWRLNPPSIKLKVEEQLAVDFLKAGGHMKFIRKKEVVDLESLKKDPDFARSLSIVEYTEGAEYFFVKPHGVQVNFTRRMKAPVAKIPTIKKNEKSKKKKG